MENGVSVRASSGLRRCLWEASGGLRGGLLEASWNLLGPLGRQLGRLWAPDPNFEQLLPGSAQNEHPNLEGKNVVLKLKIEEKRVLRGDSEK